MRTRHAFTSVVPIAALASALALPPQDATRIYVYAQRDTAARSWIAISCGGAVVAELKRGTFFAINVAPAAYTLFVDKGVPLSIDAHPGEESFVRLDWRYGMDRPPIPVLAKVRQSEARKEMKFLSYISAKRVHSSLVPKTDPSPPIQPQLRRRDER
jgi:hypothetical protein